MTNDENAFTRFSTTPSAGWFRRVLRVTYETYERVGSQLRKNANEAESEIIEGEEATTAHLHRTEEGAVSWLNVFILEYSKRAAHLGHTLASSANKFPANQSKVSENISDRALDRL